MVVSMRASGRVIRVLLADSNQTQSQLLSSALRRHSGFMVASCGSALSDCLRALELSPADVILLGSGLANDGLCPDFESLNTLRERHAQTSLVLLLDSYNRDLVVNALRAGVRGLFCRASQPFKALCKCIQAVHQGQVWTNNEQLIFLIDALTLGPSLHVIDARGESLLTPREEQVVAHVSAGLPNRSIARHLGVAESTIKKSLLRVFDKLGVSNRVELVLYALTRRDMKTQEPVVPPSASVPAPRPRNKAAYPDMSEMRNAPTNGHARLVD